MLCRQVPRSAIQEQLRIIFFSCKISPSCMLITPLLLHPYFRDGLLNVFVILIKWRCNNGLKRPAIYFAQLLHLLQKIALFTHEPLEYI